MNRTDRLLAIVLELQGRDLVTADDLARTFEVTKRTIYRDIQALNESGVPVVSAAGQGYWLMEGYFLPPVSLSPDEAIILILGSNLMTSSFDAQYKTAAQSASRKIEALLKDQVQDEVTYLKNNIRFISPDAQAQFDIPDLLPKLRRSIIEQRTIFMHYSKKAVGQKAEQSSRHIDPYSLIHFNGTWMLSAYCQLRKGIRMFRLNRIKKLELTEQTFVRQKDFDVHKLRGTDDRNVSVELLFDESVSAWVKERPAFFVTSTEDTSEGLKVILHLRTIEDCVSWVLSWGAKVSVIHPRSLKDRLKEEVVAMLQQHSE